MINKKIHYIWVGNAPKPKLVLDCIESWEKFAPDFEIIEWNESNFDVESNQFVKEAYKNQKWAFVSDYIRLKVLYENGGVYLDTDMELLKPINELLVNNAFAGFEDSKYVAAGIIGATKGNQWIKYLLDIYETKSFYRANGKMDLTPIVVLITRILREQYGLTNNKVTQVLNNDVVIYSKEYFYPISLGDKINKFDRKEISKTSYTIHHYAASWLDTKGRLKLTIRKILGSQRVEMIKKYVDNIKSILKRGI